jgi:arginase family enzyme
MMRIAEMIGKKKSVTVIDVSELCPVFDVSGTAARLWPQLLKRAAKRSMRAYGAAT